MNPYQDFRELKDNAFSAVDAHVRLLFVGDRDLWEMSERKVFFFEIQGMVCVCVCVCAASVSVSVFVCLCLRPCACVCGCEVAVVQLLYLSLFLSPLCLSLSLCLSVCLSIYLSVCLQAEKLNPESQAGNLDPRCFFVSASRQTIGQLLIEHLGIQSQQQNTSCR